jgi:hypothetical protein
VQRDISRPIDKEAPMPSDPSVKAPLPPYGPAIQDAVASGDLAKMKAVARQAERFVAEFGDIPASLEALKLEIAKLERAPKKG